MDSCRGRPPRSAASDKDSTGPVWRALADPSRRRLLDLLREGPRTTSALAEEFAITRFAVMKHLDVLAEADLVLVERRGRERWNFLNPVPLRLAYERWMAPHAERAALTTLRLKEAAEGRSTAMTETLAAQPTLDVRTEVTVEAPVERVYDTLLAMGSWWPHRFRDGSRVVFEPRVGGRFYEDWEGESGALYGTVTRLDRPTALTVDGPLGMSGPVVSTWTMEVAEVGPGRTAVRLHHRAFGDIDAETRAGYTAGWDAVLAALAARVA